MTSDNLSTHENDSNANKNRHDCGAQIEMQILKREMTGLRNNLCAHIILSIWALTYLINYMHYYYVEKEDVRGVYEQIFGQ